jgi:hypothetical protein
MKSSDKMNKAAIWQWFIGQTPPKYKLSRKKSERDNDKYQIRYTAIINGDRLIIGLWRGYNAEPIGVYYMTPSGTGNVSTDGKNWHNGKLEWICVGGYSYWGSYYEYEYRILDGKDEAIAWLKKHFSDQDHPWRWENYYQVTDMIDTIECNIGYIKRKKSRIRKETKISNWANSLPALPADFDTWIHETVFSGAHYAFYLKTKNRYYCTACNGEHAAKAWKHLKYYTCPTNGKAIKVDKVNHAHSQGGRVLLIQSHYDMDGNICSVARHFSTKAAWGKSGYNHRVWPEEIIPLPLDGSRVNASKIVYNRGGEKWSDRNSCNYQHSRGFCYPDVSALQGTAYANIGINVAASKGWKLDYNTLMSGWHDDPRMEYLIKGDYYALVDDLIEGAGDGCGRLMFGENIQDVLGIDGQMVNRLRHNNGGVYYLQWLRSAYMCGYKLPEDTIQYFAKNKISPHSVAFAINCGMSPVQVANYLQKPHEYSNKARYSYYCRSKVDTIIRQWSDYIDMAKKLKLDEYNPAVHKPKDLKARHDELVEIFNAQRDELEKARIESEYPNVKPVCEKIKAMYEWGDGIHEVVVPTGAAEIMREGRLLSHCVGSSNRYFDRIASEESYVMFLRHSSDREKPWYTLEVEPGGCIRQLRTIGDAEGEDRAEAKEFLTKWRKEISRRIGTAEREAAAVSREKRLAEFEELRRNGNIIRNGRLAGKLLVDVLEADFKEYNTEIA